MSNDIELKRCQHKYTFTTGAYFRCTLCKKQFTAMHVAKAANTRPPSEPINSVVVTDEMDLLIEGLERIHKKVEARGLGGPVNGTLGVLTQAKQIRQAMIAAAPSTTEQELDDCEVCGGTQGGVKGNENVIDGVVICDYCHAWHMRFGKFWEIHPLTDKPDCTTERSTVDEEQDELYSWPCQQLHGGKGAGIRDNVEGLCTHPVCHPRNDDRDSGNTVVVDRAWLESAICPSNQHHNYLPDKCSWCRKKQQALLGVE